ncbi:MAG: hypothetical protein ACI83W_000924 [Marinoscillum sp.]|jgi:hypothetical protein
MTFRTRLTSSAFCLIMLVILGCSPKKPVDKTAYWKEQEARELKRILPIDLKVRGEELGAEIIDTVSRSFEKRLEKAIVITGVTGAINACNLEAMSIVKVLEDSLGVSIARISSRELSGSDSLNKIEKEIWEAYQYSPQSASLYTQESDPSNLIVTKPVYLSSKLCLSCHGNPELDVTEALSEKQMDKTIAGSTAGDLIGIWRVIIPKKTVVSLL